MTVVTEGGPGAESVVVQRPLHRAPPLTVAGVLLRHRWTVPAVAGLFAVLALAAALADGALFWDEPIRDWVSSHRSGALDTFFTSATRLGGWEMVVLGLVVLLALAWRVCAPVAILLIVATIARPVFESILKAVIGRERPTDGLVTVDAPAFPSGHVMAAIALWGLVPPVVALVTDRRAVWWAATVVSGTIVLVVAASRVYLGVHWFSDVVGALLFGVLFLLAIEWLADRSHRRYPCAACTDGCTDR